MQMGWLGKKPRLPLDIHMAAVIIMYSPSSHWTSFCKGFGALPVPTTESSSLSLSLSLSMLSTLRIYIFWGNEQRKFIIANKASCE